MSRPCVDQQPLAKRQRVFSPITQSMRWFTFAAPKITLGLTFQCDFMDMSSDELLAALKTHNNAHLLYSVGQHKTIDLQPPASGCTNQSFMELNSFVYSDDLELFCGCSPNIFAKFACRFQHMT